MWYIYIYIYISVTRAQDRTTRLGDWLWGWESGLDGLVGWVASKSGATLERNAFWSKKVVPLSNGMQVRRFFIVNYWGKFQSCANGCRVREVGITIYHYLHLKWKLLSKRTDGRTDGRINMCRSLGSASIRLRIYIYMGLGLQALRCPPGSSMEWPAPNLLKHSHVFEILTYICWNIDIFRNCDINLSSWHEFIEIFTFFEILT